MSVRRKLIGGDGDGYCTMSRSAEAYQQEQEMQRQAEYDDMECCAWQENLSGCDGMTYTHCEPLKQQENQNGRKK
jgi:hypothetical protein